MLREVHIQNLALIDEITIELGPGLNVFTGATGVGKSLVVGALALLLGGRASADSVRTGEAKARVAGCFEIDDPAIRQHVGDLTGVDPEDGELALSREVDASGRSRCRVNGVPVTVSMLKSVGGWLVDIHGQQEHESLRAPAHQLDMLDRFGGAAAQREAFAQLRADALGLRDRRNRVRDNLAAIRAEVDFLKFQTDEIDEAKLEPGEDAALADERKILVNAERLHEATAAAHDELYESEASVCARVNRISRDLSTAADVDARLTEIRDACEQARVQLEDAAFDLGRYVEDFSFDPDRLAQVDDRLELIRRLQGKYGQTVDEVLAKREELAARLAELSADSEGLGPLEAELAKQLEALTAQAAALTETRRNAAKRLSTAVERELKDLGMGAGKFGVAVEPAAAQGEALLDASTTTGADRVEFTISTNPGEPLRPVARIASGGEISRTMLAIKKCLAAVDRVSVFLFDEIDANIGGRLGSVVGEKLAQVAQSHQVICVTHLPQIACFAGRQLKVQKQVRGRRTTTSVEPLDEAARRDELAEMIRGDETSDLTRAQADEMLAAARQRVQSQTKPPNRPANKTARPRKGANARA